MTLALVLTMYVLSYCFFMYLAKTVYTSWSNGKTWPTKILIVVLILNVLLLAPLCMVMVLEEVGPYEDDK